MLCNKCDRDTRLPISDIASDCKPSEKKKSKMAVRKKVGAPDWKYYESPDTVALFEPVKNYLLKNCKKVIIM